MFNTNIFAKMTHKTPSVSEIEQKSPEELKTYISSDANLAILADNSDLKNAALDNLAATYTSTDASVSTTDKQTAAVVAADISIQTVPVAAQFSSDLLASLVDGSVEALTSSSGEVTESTVSSFIKTVLPADVIASIDAGDATPPSSFTDLISAFVEANDAYQALGNSLQGVDTDGDGQIDSYAYADGVVSSSESSELAINAVIAGLITAIDTNGSADTTPATSAEISEALWNAMVTGTADFTIEDSVLDSLTSTNADGSVNNPIASIVLASSLASLLGGM
jgi:hypothetical protein